jgi:flagellin-like hook-associated protein FlgL
LQNLQATQSQVQQVQLQTQQQTSNLQGADLAQVVVNLQAAQNAYQLTLASTARIFSGTSLLDFLK